MEGREESDFEEGRVDLELDACANSRLGPDVSE